MSLTILLILITVVISFSAWNKPQLMDRLIFNPYLIKNKNQYYRFISSGFIHLDQGHLIFNMMTFYFFGRNVEFIFQGLFGEFTGNLLFIALYFLGIIASDLPTFFKHKDNYLYNALGASGGVSSVLFCSIIFQPLNKICLFFAICMPGFILGILYLIYSYYSGKKSQDNINHDAHLWGALFGILFAILIKPEVINHFLQEITSYIF